MKEFRKNEQGLFICEECNHFFHKKDKLSYHVNTLHDGQKIYYDKWLKDENDLCKICNKETEFFKFKYRNCCSKKCSIKYNRIKIQENC